MVDINQLDILRYDLPLDFLGNVPIMESEREETIRMNNPYTKQTVKTWAITPAVPHNPHWGIWSCRHGRWLMLSANAKEIAESFVNMRPWGGWRVYFCRRTYNPITTGWDEAELAYIPAEGE